MEIYIVCDMEGVTGVSSYEREASPQAPDYAHARRGLVGDLRAAIAGAEEAGASRFTIYDMHFYGDNVHPHELAGNVTLLRGKPLDNGMRRGFAGMFLVGLHAMAGAAGGVLPHSYNHEIVSIDVNGRRVGEIGLEAAAAGWHGIPLVFLAADEAGVAEAKALVGNVFGDRPAGLNAGPAGLPIAKNTDVEGAATKSLSAAGQAVLVAPEQSRERIHHAARRAVERIRDFRPFVVSGPCRVEIQYTDAALAAKVAATTEGSLRDERRVIIEAGDFWAAYRRFRRTQARDGS